MQIFLILGLFLLVPFLAGYWLCRAIDLATITHGYVLHDIDQWVALGYARRHLRRVPAPRPGCAQPGCLLDSPKGLTKRKI